MYVSCKKENSTLVPHRITLEAKWNQNFCQSLNCQSANKKNLRLQWEAGCRRWSELSQELQPELPGSRRWQLERLGGKVPAGFRRSFAPVGCETGGLQNWSKLNLLNSFKFASNFSSGLREWIYWYFGSMSFGPKLFVRKSIGRHQMLPII